MVSGRQHDLSILAQLLRIPGRKETSMTVSLDYTNLLSAAVGADNGLTDADLWKIGSVAAQAFSAVAAARGTGWLRWTKLPGATVTADRCLKLWAERAGSFDNLVVIGIGGSALGTIALKSALCHPFHNELPGSERSGARVYVLDNADPVRCSGLLEMLDPRRTLFNVITKSGSTAETAAQFLVARELVEKTVGESWPAHFVFTTDAERGDLRALAGDAGVAALEVPDGVGGRFSVLSAVGLFPAAAMGIDVRGLLAGAAQMDARCHSGDWSLNPALALGALLWGLDVLKGKRIHVLMPYASALADFADWYRQLWAESLGKNRSLDGQECSVGPTPVKALGATDQHSQVQLYTEGPADKAFVFLAVLDPGRETFVPATYPDRPAFGYLGGHGLGELLDAERRGTEVALTAAGRPNATIAIERLSAETLGGLFYLWELATACAGRLYNVDAFNQPGVEAGKRAAYALLGRAGYEEERAGLDRRRLELQRRTVS
jgi:glucose-6-phosphate isomerase